MLKMVDIEFIRKKHFVDGWSIRKISRQLGIARQTVRKALANTEFPRYHRRVPRPCPVMDPYRSIISLLPPAAGQCGSLCLGGSQ